MDPDEPKKKKLARWRLILGRDSQEELGRLGPLDPLVGDLEVMDGALELVYGGQAGGKSAGLGPRSPQIARWIKDVRRVFPPDLVTVIQGDAVERKGLKALLLEPESLEAVKPDVGLVSTLMALKELIPDKSKDLARKLVHTVVQEILKRLEGDLRRAVHGALNRRRRSPLPDPRAMDWKTTIRQNLKGWDPRRRKLLPERFYFFDRQRKGVGWRVILAMDQSGSMADSIIYGSIMGSILASMQTLETRVVVFDTEVVDLSQVCAQDPVDLLFGINLGGGTDIEKCVRYCQDLVTQPQKTLFVLLTDLYEGGNQGALLRRLEDLQASGVRTLCLLAINDQGAPAYNRDLAKQIAALGIPSLACHPELLPQFLAGALRGDPLEPLARQIQKDSQELKK